MGTGSYDFGQSIAKDPMMNMCREVVSRVSDLATDGSDGCTKILTLLSLPPSSKMLEAKQDQEKVEAFNKMDKTLSMLGQCYVALTPRIQAMKFQLETANRLNKQIAPNVNMLGVDNGRPLISPKNLEIAESTIKDASDAKTAGTNCQNIASDLKILVSLLQIPKSCVRDIQQSQELIDPDWKEAYIKVDDSLKRSYAYSLAMEKDRALHESNCAEALRVADSSMPGLKGARDYLAQNLENGGQNSQPEEDQDQPAAAPKSIAGNQDPQDNTAPTTSPQKSNAGNGYYAGGGNQAPSGHTKDRMKKAGTIAAGTGLGLLGVGAPLLTALSQGGGGGASPAAAGGGGNPVGAGGAAPGATGASAGAGGSAGQQMPMAGGGGTQSINGEQVASIQSGVQTTKVDPNNPLGAQTNSGTNTNTAGTKLDPNKLQSGKNAAVSNPASNAQGSGVTGANNTQQQAGKGTTTTGGGRNLFNTDSSVGGGGYIMPGYGMQRGYGGSGESEPGASLDYNDTRRQDAYQRSGSQPNPAYVPANSAESAQLVNCRDKWNLEHNPVCATRAQRYKSNRQNAMSMPLLNIPNRRAPSGHSGH
jgi:hypothetical protein